MSPPSSLHSPLLPPKTAVSSIYQACAVYASDVALLSAPLLFLLLLLCLDLHGQHKIVAMAATMCWVFIWWISEAVPVAITSLVPLFLLPFLQIQTADQVAKSYMNDTIFLLIGSFILATAVEHYGLHKRLALHMLLLFGGNRMDPRLLLLGFCVGPAFISMWIHNTAAAVMMMPVALGVLQKVQINSTTSTLVEEEAGISMEDKEEKKLVLNFCRAVVLAVSYGVTIGGMSTLTGTGVNLILAGMWQSAFPHAPPITYVQWLFFGLPLALALTLFLWIILCICFCPPSAVRPISASLHKAHIQEELNLLGPVPFAEAAVLTVFVLLVMLWMTKSISSSIPGWGHLFNNYPGDGTVSVMMATLLFVIPNRKDPTKKIMDWEKCRSIPWSIVLLLGAGFALADGIRSSGLSDLISRDLDFLESSPYILLPCIIACMNAILTECTSNNAAATILIPLVAEVAISIHRHPLYLMVPATIGAQLSYMLPIATPANSVGYATGFVRMADMVVIGFILKFAAILLLSVLMPTLGSAVFKTSTPFVP